MEGGIPKADKTEFRECCLTTWRQPYIMQLALSAGRRGLLFGYDTGVISGVSLCSLFIGVQLAGFASNKTALALSLVTSGLNAIGSIVSILFVDRYGRRKLLLWSLFFIIICLVGLFGVFREAALRSPDISEVDSSHFGGNATCPLYLTAGDASSWSCMSCLKSSSDCAFCANGLYMYGWKKEWNNLLEH